MRNIPRFCLIFWLIRIKESHNGAFAAGNAQRALLFCWINVNKMFTSSVISQNDNYQWEQHVLKTGRCSFIFLWFYGRCSFIFQDALDKCIAIVPRSNLPSSDRLACKTKKSNKITLLIVDASRAVDDVCGWLERLLNVRVPYASTHMRA